MAEKFMNKYRVKSARWKNWDYSADGLYFITINIAHRNCLLGRITDNEMHLSDYGKIVAAEWDKSFDMRKELFCDSFVIMPNHLHAILRIEHQINDIDSVENKGIGLIANNDEFLMDNNDDYLFDDSDHLKYVNILRDAHKTSNNQRFNNVLRGFQGNKQMPVVNENMTHTDGQYGNTGVAYRPPKSISSFVGGFKSSVSTKINVTCKTKRPSIWQTRFHDHVIRDHHEHRYIKHYIETNIENWNKEQLYVD